MKQSYSLERVRIMSLIHDFCPFHISTGVRIGML